jgi:hypothetical protein
MDGGTGRSDIAVVEERKFLRAEIEGMSKMSKSKLRLLEVQDGGKGEVVDDSVRGKSSKQERN